MRILLIKAVATLVMLCLLMPQFTSNAATELDARSVILIEANTGAVLYEKNADEALPPASVTKVMTLLLIMEAIDEGKINLSDQVTVSEKAASMGGSQVFLQAGEVMCVEDLLKSVVIASANDAALALAEHIMGSEEEFVVAMNQKASDLGMNNTNFENTNGLDDTTVHHVTSARDISKMSAELIIKHPLILKYSSIWQDTIRDGKFTLSNTNKLIRFYPGANGLKTGSTAKAKFCISASAKRDGLQLITVVMGSSTRDSRNSIAKQMFDYGFANYAYLTASADQNLEATVEYGVKKQVKCGYSEFCTLSKKTKETQIETEVVINQKLKAPINAGDEVGTVIYSINGEKVGQSQIVAIESVEKTSFFYIIKKIFKLYFIN